MKLVNTSILDAEDYATIKQAGIKEKTYLAAIFFASLSEAGLDFFSVKLRLEDLGFSTTTDPETREQVCETWLELPPDVDPQAALKALCDLNDGMRWEIRDA